MQESNLLKHYIRVPPSNRSDHLARLVAGNLAGSSEGNMKPCRSRFLFDAVWAGMTYPGAQAPLHPERRGASHRGDHTPTSVELPLQMKPVFSHAFSECVVERLHVGTLIPIGFHLQYLRQDRRVLGITQSSCVLIDQRL